MIEFRLLGSVDLKGSDGQTVRSVLAQPKRVALLAYLAAARPNGFHRRDKLLGLFWAESDQERGRGALRKAVYLLRQSLGEEVIINRGDEEVGLAEGAVWCDAAAFEAALEGGNPEEALKLYHGDLLEGFFLSEVPEFEHWLESERERLRRLASDAAWALADRADSAGSAVEACRHALRAAGFAPDDESTLRRLLELLDRVGDRAAAVKEYEAFARRMRDEYEAEPSPETQALIAAIREREVSAVGGTAERPVENPAGVQGAPAPEPAPVTLRPDPQTEPRPISLLRVLTTYAVVSLAVLVAVHIFTLQLGLPDWFFPSAVAILLSSLPIIVATALVQGATLSAARAGAGAKAPSVAAWRWLSWRNAIGATVVGLAVLGLAVGGYMAMRVLGVGPWATLIAKGLLEERDVIVLADFEDNTGDSILAHTVTEAFRVKLEQSPVVRVADDDHVGRVLERMEREPDAPLTGDLAREVAVREGLKAVVTGEVNPAGSGYVLLLRLTAAETGETLGSFLETAADPDAIIVAIDGLSAQVRERIGESLRTIRSSPPLSQVRTASLEALRLRTEAALFNRRGDDRRALELVNRAIEIDTAFASAYAARAAYLANFNLQREQRISDATRAYELRHRLPLWEQYEVEAEYHSTVTGNWEARINSYRAMLQLEPDYVEGWNNLGVTYRQLREFARAEEMFRRAIELDSLYSLSWNSLARVQFNQGKFDEAEETLRQWEAKMPDFPTIVIRRAAFASARGDYETAALYYRRWRDLRPEGLTVQRAFNSHMGGLAMVQGRLAEADSHFRDVMALDEERELPIRYISIATAPASLHVWFLGDTIRALETVADAIERYPLVTIDPLGRPYATLAGFYAFAGAPERARELLVEWEAVVPPELRRTQEVSRRAAWGAVALAEGRADDALTEFRFSHERQPCPTCGLPLLGRAYELAGQPDSALVMYERYLATLYDFRMYLGPSPADGADPYWRPVVYERLGDLYEQRADTAKAILYYGKFADLWKDADPELQPRVEAARRAIEALSPDT